MTGLGLVQVQVTGLEEDETNTDSAPTSTMHLGTPPSLPPITTSSLVSLTPPSELRNEEMTMSPTVKQRDDDWENLNENLNDNFKFYYYTK